MLKIGLTGGIGCGKSTVTQSFAEKGITIIDADKIAREVVAVGTTALKEIITIFGSNVLQQDGSLDRTRLKKQIFSNKKKLVQLEAIVHPRIYHSIENKLKQSEAMADFTAYIIVDIPLLIEKNYIDLFDKIIVVDCLPKQQIQRVQQRDNMDISIIQSIINKQISRTERLKHASYILDNSGSKENLLLKINQLHQHLLRLGSKPR